MDGIQDDTLLIRPVLTVFEIFYFGQSDCWCGNLDLENARLKLAFLVDNIQLYYSVLKAENTLIKIRVPVREG